MVYLLEKDEKCGGKENGKKEGNCGADLISDILSLAAEQSTSGARRPTQQSPFIDVTYW